MSQFCAGNTQAFEALFQRHAGALRGYLARVTGSPAVADDLCQTTFLSLVRSSGRFQEGSRFKPWVYTIATNAARDHLRRRQEVPVPDEELGRGLTAEPALHQDAGLERRVENALAQLPANQREAIILHRFQGLSFAEAAEVTGASETAMKVRAHRGYERLRELLKSVWEESQ